MLLLVPCKVLLLLREVVLDLEYPELEFESACAEFVEASRLRNIAGRSIAIEVKRGKTQELA